MRPPRKGQRGRDRSRHTYEFSLSISWVGPPSVRDRATSSRLKLNVFMPDRGELMKRSTAHVPGFPPPSGGQLQPPPVGGCGGSLARRGVARSPLWSGSPPGVAAARVARVRRAVRSSACAACPMCRAAHPPRRPLSCRPTRPRSIPSAPPLRFPPFFLLDAQPPALIAHPGTVHPTSVLNQYFSTYRHADGDSMA